MASLPSPSRPPFPWSVSGTAGALRCAPGLALPDRPSLSRFCCCRSVSTMANTSSSTPSSDMFISAPLFNPRAPARLASERREPPCVLIYEALTQHRALLLTVSSSCPCYSVSVPSANSAQLDSASGRRCPLCPSPCSPFTLGGACTASPSRATRHSGRSVRTRRTGGSAWTAGCRRQQPGLGAGGQGHWKCSLPPALKPDPALAANQTPGPSLGSGQAAPAPPPAPEARNGEKSFQDLLSQWCQSAGRPEPGHFRPKSIGSGVFTEKTARSPQRRRPSSVSPVPGASCSHKLEAGTVVPPPASQRFSFIFSPRTLEQNLEPDWT